MAVFWPTALLLSNYLQPLASTANYYNSTNDNSSKSSNNNHSGGNKKAIHNFFFLPFVKDEMKRNFSLSVEELSKNNRKMEWIKKIKM